MLRGEGSNLQHPAPKADVLPIELPRKETSACIFTTAGTTGPPRGACQGPGTTSEPARARRFDLPMGKSCPSSASVPPAMGSLIKKRRKRMRKKKHKKMLKRTRWQRRAAGK